MDTAPTLAVKAVKFYVDTVVTMAQAEEVKVDGQGIEAQPKEVDMG